MVLFSDSIRIRRDTSEFFCNLQIYFYHFILVACKIPDDNYFFIRIRNDSIFEVFYGKIWNTDSNTFRRRKGIRVI